MKYTYNISGKLISLSCREEWKPTADFLAGVLLEEEKAGGVLTEDLRLCGGPLLRHGGGPVPQPADLP